MQQEYTLQEKNLGAYMKNLFKVFLSYLKSNFIIIMILLLTYGIFLGVLFLYSLPLEAVGYGALLASVFILMVGLGKFYFFYKKYTTLQKLQKTIGFEEPLFPAPKDAAEEEYQLMLKNLLQERTQMINQKDKAYADMVDYYTIWVHQIKTPIAALNLLIQTDQSDKKEELLQQLFKVEQYVEMALQYIRMESLSSDWVFKEYSLDEIVKQGIRKYAKSFIRQKLKLNYQELNTTVLTDEKWLVFVIEQILSNALKYTTKGEISIYMDPKAEKTLVIEDTGIGIEPEDLPRVFEKGFTGYTGRADKKSTGIGLYLCKEILNKLTHTITIESEVDQGTKVKLGLARTEFVHE